MASRKESGFGSVLNAVNPRKAPCNVPGYDHAAAPAFSWDQLTTLLGYYEAVRLVSFGLDWLGWVLLCHVLELQWFFVNQCESIGKMYMLNLKHGVPVYQGCPVTKGS